MSIDNGRSATAARRLRYVGAGALLMSGVLIAGVWSTASTAPPDPEPIEQPEETAATASDPQPAREATQAAAAEPASPSAGAAPSPAAGEPDAIVSVALAASPPRFQAPQPRPLPVRTAEEQRKLTNEDEWTPPYVRTAEQEARLHEDDPPEPAPVRSPASLDRPEPHLSDDEEPKPRVLTEDQRRLLQDD